MAGFRRLPSGKWQASVRLPDGRRVTKSSVLRGVVRDWANDVEARLARGEIRDPRLGRVTVGQWLNSWLAARVVEPETAAADAATWRRIRDTFGSRPLVAVTRLEIQTWVRRMEADQVGRGAIQRAYNRLRAAFNAAVDEGILVASPCRRITLPAAPIALPRWYTPDEVWAIVDQLNEPHATMALLMCWSGLRWGEAAGLRTEDVDWLRRRVKVVGAMTQGGRWKEYPKSKRSRREVPVPAWLLERMSGLVGPGRELMFTSRQGDRPLLGRNWRRSWDLAIGKAGGRRESPHVCRHSAASWLVQGGVDLYRVQELLGHESFSTTQRYSHLRKGAHDQVEGVWENMPTHLRRTPSPIMDVSAGQGVVRPSS